MSKLYGLAFSQDSFELTILRDCEGICRIILPWQAIPEYVSCPEDALLRDARRQLQNYFIRKYDRISLPLSLTGSPYALSVYTALLKNVPYGKTITYKELAELSGGSSRSIGNALRNNPLPILIPCHRVIRSDGSLGGYAGPQEEHILFKRRLLELEGANIKP